jgi:hypothetical protein
MKILSSVLLHRVVDIARMMKAASTSETSVNFYQTTRRSNQKTVIFYSPPP